MNSKDIARVAQAEVDAEEARRQIDLAKAVIRERQSRPRYWFPWRITIKRKT